MHVCMNTRMRVCMHVCMYACVYICMYICVHICMCVYAWMRTCMCARVHGCVRACLLACVCVLVHACVCVCVCTHACERMRLCDDEGRLDLKHKGALADGPKRFSPWFDFHNPGLSGACVIFGHWSALGIVQKPPYLGLDSGCIWGRCLSAVHLESEHVNIISVPCDPNATIDAQ